MKKKAVLIVVFILSGCGTVSQKVPDPFGVNLHQRLDFLEPGDVAVVYPAGTPWDGTDRYMR